MRLIDTQKLNCPYCGEWIEVVVDCSVSDQSYIEDCQVCCRPIELTAEVDEIGNVQVFARTDSDT